MKQKMRSLICSLTAQLARKMPRIPDDLLNLYSQYKHTQPPMERLVSTLRSTLEICGESFVIIDALDECIDNGRRTEILTLLTELSKWALSNLHVLVTSRKEPDIEKSLTPLLTLRPICIQTDQIQNDLRLYVRTHLRKDSDLAKWSPKIKQEIEETLIEGANGM